MMISAKRLMRRVALGAALFAASIGLASLNPDLRSWAQQRFDVVNLSLTGHFLNNGSGSAAVPVGTGCTIAAGSTDTDGSCTTSAASGSIAFATAYVTAPFCTVTDASATSTVSMPVYTTTAAQITLTTIITAHVLFWHCAAKAGG